MQMELDDMQRKKNDEVQSNRADSSGSADHRSEEHTSELQSH